MISDKDVEMAYKHKTGLTGNKGKKINNVVDFAQAKAEMDYQKVRRDLEATKAEKMAELIALNPTKKQWKVMAFLATELDIAGFDRDANPPKLSKKDDRVAKESDDDKDNKINEEFNLTALEKNCERHIRDAIALNAKDPSDGATEEMVNVLRAKIRDKYIIKARERKERVDAKRKDQIHNIPGIGPIIESFEPLDEYKQKEQGPRLPHPKELGLNER